MNNKNNVTEWWWPVVWATTLSAAPFIGNSDPWFGIWAFIGCAWGGTAMRISILRRMRSNVKLTGCALLRSPG